MLSQVTTVHESDFFSAPIEFLTSGYKLCLQAFKDSFVFLLFL